MPLRSTDWIMEEIKLKGHRVESQRKKCLVGQCAALHPPSSQQGLIVSTENEEYHLA